MYSRADALRLAALIARRFEEPTPLSPLPKILEFIVFGSTSRGKRNRVSDLDIALLADYQGCRDCRFIFFPSRLREILRELKSAGLPPVPVDFEPFWIRVLWDAKVQKFYRGAYKDPQFVPNVLRSFLRWDPRTGDFKRADRAYLNKYMPKSPV